MFQQVIKHNLVKEADIATHTVFAKVTEMNKWTTIPMKNDSVPVERHGHTVVNYKDNIYLFGGTPDGSSGLSDLLVLDAINCCWVRPVVRGILPAGRYRHTATVIGSHMYLFLPTILEFTPFNWYFTFFFFLIR